MGLCSSAAFFLSFPRLHFFLVSQAPLAADATDKVRLTTKELVAQATRERNFYSNVKTDDGKVLATSLIFRGAMTTQDVDCEVDKLQTKNGDDFVEWIPNNVKATFPSSTCFLCTGSLLVKFVFGVPPVPLTFWTRSKEKFH
jgi:hypothetical protein